ncbi:MAG: serine protease [Synechococcaceae cyanobacterium SM2_3_1]|nr:serine protease [Synechococcaceae cyanobacterium SM2_3_1]
MHLFFIGVQSVMFAKKTMKQIHKVGSTILSLGLLCSCGTSPETTVLNPETNLIIGGRPANISSFPWLARLNIDGNICSGTLIESDIILTAAHCVEGRDPRNGIAIFGQTDTSEGVLSGQIVKTKEFRVFPEWSRERVNIGGDIALIQLERSIERTTLPWNDDQTDLSNQSATIVGWGDTQVQPSVQVSLDQLNQGTVTILNDQECINLLGVEFTTNNQICTFNPDTTTCFGDSGGPLLTSIQGETKTAGIVSWSRGTSCNRPTVHTEISFFTNWINSQLASRVVPDPRPDLPLAVTITDQLTGQELFKEYDFTLEENPETFSRFRYVGVAVTRSTFESRIEVLNANNQIIRTSRPFLGNINNSRLVFLARENETYRIRVSSATGRATGEFDLSII